MPPGVVRRLLFSERMWPEVSALDLTREVPALRIPVFFFLGRHDHVVDSRVSAAYVERLEAPAKRPVAARTAGGRRSSVRTGAPRTVRWGDTDPGAEPRSGARLLRAGERV